MSRMMRVIWNRARVMEGMMRDLRPDPVRNPVVHQPMATTSPRPKVGSQRRMTPNKRMRRMPMRKVGSDTPTRERVMKPREMIPCRRSAV